MASPETVPRDLDETTVTIIQDTPERRLAVLGEIDEAYGRDVRAGARRHGRRLRGGVKRAVAPFARALGARAPVTTEPRPEGVLLRARLMQRPVAILPGPAVDVDALFQQPLALRHVAVARGVQQALRGLS